METNIYNWLYGSTPFLSFLIMAASVVGYPVLLKLRFKIPMYFGFIIGIILHMLLIPITLGFPLYLVSWLLIKALKYWFKKNLLKKTLKLTQMRTL